VYVSTKFYVFKYCLIYLDRYAIEQFLAVFKEFASLFQSSELNNFSSVFLLKELLVNISFKSSTFNWTELEGKFKFRKSLGIVNFKKSDLTSKWLNLSSFSFNLVYSTA